MVRLAEALFGARYTRKGMRRLLTRHGLTAPTPALAPPRYLFRGSAMGLPAFGFGMTSPRVVDDPGGGVTGPGGIDGPLMRGLSTGFTRAGRALRNVDVAARCRGKAGRKRDGGACT
ncbi:hypothetical protein [Streptomyces sp. NPDC051577]|uniref:hypothetical protein n=1 Tax=Streptomyces sp. NPDC051577 TaxID=3155166 RepID=UPI00343FFB97